MWGAAMRECQIYGRDLTTDDPVPLGKREWVITSSSSSPWRDSFKVEHHLRPAFEQIELAIPATIALFGGAIKDQGLLEWASTFLKKAAVSIRGRAVKRLINSMSFPATVSIRLSTALIRLQRRLRR